MGLLGMGDIQVGIDATDIVNWRSPVLARYTDASFNKSVAESHGFNLKKNVPFYEEL